MENSDPTDGGIILPPQTATRLIAEAAARQVVMEHIRLCPFASADIEQRLRRIETGFARLTGFMLGSGLLGGATAAVVSRLINP